MNTWLDNHRGPFRFLVTRTNTRTKTKFSSEWLTGTVERDDVESEARALLTDPRDTIVQVYVWSIREDSFAGGYKRDTRTPESIRECA